MLFMFAQMQLMALPIKSIAGSEYVAEKMVENIVVLIPLDGNNNNAAIKWHSIDPRITAQQVISGSSTTQGLYILTVPTFKPMTEILHGIARKLPLSRVLEISSQSVVQVWNRLSTNQKLTTN